MKRTYTLILLTIVLFTACSSKMKIAATAAVMDGLSFEKAIIIEATNDRQGVDDEYIWLRKNYPGCRTNSQSLNMYHNKPYDILHITTVDGKTMAIYFNISKSFGKM